MLTYNKCGFNFLPCKAVSDKIIYRYKYVISRSTVGIKLMNTEGMVTGFQMKDLNWTHKNAYSGYDIPSEMFQMRSSMSLYSNSIKVKEFWILKPIQHKGENSGHKCKQNLQITVPEWLWQCKSAVRKFITLFWSSIH